MSSSYRMDEGRGRFNRERQERLAESRPGSSSAGPRIEEERINDAEYEEVIHHARTSRPAVPEPTYINIERSDPGPSRIPVPPPRHHSPPPVVVNLEYGGTERPPRRHSPRRIVIDPPYDYAERASRRPYVIDPVYDYADRRPGPRRPPPFYIPARPPRHDGSLPRYYERPPRRSGSGSLPHSPSPERPVRPVPPGFVQPAPLISRPDRLGGHDLLGLASNPRPKSDPDIKGKVVLCLYHNSKRTFDYRTVQYISKQGQSIRDRELFYMMRNTYQYELRGWIRRWFSFKGLTTVRLLLVSESTC
jgi:hypothetical protein